MAPQEHHDSAHEIAAAVLADRADRLAAAGLRSEIEVKRWGEGAGAQAELSISLWRGSTFVDFLEDFIVRDGRPTTSPDELREWVATEIDEILDAEGSDRSA
jgi:hypothetical protein